MAERQRWRFSDWATSRVDGGGGSSAQGAKREDSDLLYSEAAQTVEEIDKAVRGAWKHVTPQVCEAIMKRVRRNMIKVIEKKGGNFYDER